MIKIIRFFPHLSLILVSIIISLVCQGDVMAGQRIYDYQDVKAEVIYFGKNDMTPEYGIFYITRNLTDGLMLDKISEINVGQIIQVKMTEQISKPGTRGILDFKVEISAVAFEQGNYQEKKSDLSKLLKQIDTSERNYHFLIMTLESNGVKLRNASALIELEKARATNKIALFDYCWILKSCNQEKKLAQVAAVDSYARAYYLFYLLDHGKNQAALELCANHHADLQQVIGNMHNAAEISDFLPVKVAYDKVIFDYYFKDEVGFSSKDVAKDSKDELGVKGMDLDLIQLIELELFSKLNKSKSARKIAQAIFKDNPEVLKQTRPYGYGMTYQGRSMQRLFEFPTTSIILLRSQKLLGDHQENNHNAI